jgi:hypothetical protein
MIGETPVWMLWAISGLLAFLMLLAQLRRFDPPFRDFRWPSH